MEDEDKEEKKDENIEMNDIEEKDEKDESKALKLKMVYNKNDLIKKPKKEIAFIRKKIMDKKKEFRKAKKEFNKANRYSKKTGKVFGSLIKKDEYKFKKNIEVENLKFRVNWIKRYISQSIDEYFLYFKKECDKQENAKTFASTIDGEIEYKLKTKKEKEEFKKNQEFYSLEFHPSSKKNSK